MSPQPKHSSRRSSTLRNIAILSLPLFFYGTNSALPLQNPPTEFQENETYIIQKGDSLLGVMVERNIPFNKAQQAIQALKKYYDPKTLLPKDQLNLLFEDKTHPDSFQGFRLIHADQKGYRVQLDFEGQFSASTFTPARATVPSPKSDVTFTATTIANLSQDLTPVLASQTRKILRQRFNLAKDFYRADRLEILANPQNPQEILKLSFQQKERWHEIYHFPKMGKTAFYYKDGANFAPSFLKHPIKGKYRISSHFGHRKHPTLKRYRLHTGTDFAAPTGTEILAASDGKITFLDYQSSNGNHIEIDHGRGVSTSYSHMRGFASFLRKGSTVRKGQVIGYVGSTGMSTGPHLHYEVRYNGKAVNAMTAKLSHHHALTTQQKNEFLTQTAQINHYYRCASGSLWNVSYQTTNKIKNYLEKLGVTWSSRPSIKQCHLNLTS